MILALLDIVLFNLILAVHWGLSNEYVSQYLV